jgi:hypothetical protein
MKLRFLTGGVIALHGLMRIIFTDEYLGFIYDNFYSMLPYDTLLTVGVTIIPFLEFFIGLLIMFILEKKSPIWIGLLLSITSSIFLMIAGVYSLLIYHGIVLLFLGLLTFRQIKTQQKKIIL